MAVDVQTEIMIDRPCAQVATYAADPSNAPQWYVNIESVRWQTPPPLVLGSRLEFVAHFLGRRLSYTYEIVDLVPHTRLSMRTACVPPKVLSPWRRRTHGNRARRGALA